MNKPIYYLLTLSYLLITSFDSSLFAQINPVTTVWRADTRAPEEIFQNGFRPWGNNNNLVDHALGDSVSTGGSYPDLFPDSMFISTSAHTTDSEFLENILDIIYQFNTNLNETWVYDINPDTNFYNSAESLIACLVSQRGSLNDFELNNTNLAIQIAIGQNEWVSRGLIPPTRIRGARLWSSGTGELDRDSDPIVNWQPTETYIPNDSSNNKIPHNQYDGRELQSNRNPYRNILGQSLPNETNILVVESASGSYGSTGFCQEGVASTSSNNTSEREKGDTEEKKYCRLVNPREEMIKKLMPIFFLNFKVNAAEATPKKQKSKKPAHNEL